MLALWALWLGSQEPVVSEPAEELNERISQQILAHSALLHQPTDGPHSPHTHPPPLHRVSPPALAGPLQSPPHSLAGGVVHLMVIFQIS